MTSAAFPFGHLIIGTQPMHFLLNQMYWKSKDKINTKCGKHRKQSIHYGVHNFIHFAILHISFVQCF